MRKRTVLFWCTILAAAAVTAEERSSLSLVKAQPLHAGTVEATGRLLPRFSAMVGARVAGHISEWGRNADGDWLDVGMSVESGWLLFRVEPSTFAAKVASKQAALTTAESSLANLIAPTRPEQVAVLKATVAELEARRQDRERDAERYRRLVEVDKTMPLKRLEEVQVEVTALQSQLAAARARLEEAETGPTKTQIAIAEARVQEARAELTTAQLDLRDTEVKAPFTGVITRRFKGLGDFVASAPFVDVLELVTVDRLEAELRLPETYLPQLVPGETRVLLACPLAGKNLELTVSRIVPQIDQATGTFAFRVAVPAGSANGLVAGAFVTGRLQLAARADAVLVPLRALVEENGQTAVVVAENGKLARRRVDVSSRLTEGAVVRGGIQAGDWLVVGPVAELRDGAPLPPALSSQIR